MVNQLKCEEEKVHVVELKSINDTLMSTIFVKQEIKILQSMHNRGDSFLG